MAAYGLYTHIQSNKRRSIALLIGLFFLVYVLVFAGALVAEVLMLRRRAARLSHARRLVRLRQGGAVRHRRHHPLDPDRLQIPPVDDRRGRRRQRSHAQGGTAALQHPGESLHLARHHHAEAAHRRRRRAQRLRHRAERKAIFHHGDARPDRRAQRPGDRSRARPRAHPHPQRRRAHDGDRGGDRRRDLVLRRDDLPAVLPGLLGPIARQRQTATKRAAPARPSSSRWC